MAISVTSLGHNSAGTATTLALTSLSVPANVLIVVGTSDNTSGSSGGSCTDSAANTYTSIVSLSPDNNSTFGFGQLWNFNNNSTTLSSITYTLKSAGKKASISALYATGIISTSAIDTAVTNSAFGQNTTASLVPTITSGTPSQVGDLMVAFSFVKCGGGNSTGLTQDTGNGWTSTGGLDADLTEQTNTVGGGNQVNTGSSAKTWSPTFSFSLSAIQNWASMVVGFKAASGPTAWSGSAEFDGAGSLAATAVLALQALVGFNGTGSLSIVGAVGNVGKAEFDGAGSLSYLGSLGLKASATLSDNSPSLLASGAVAGVISATFGSTGSLSALGIDVPPGGFVAIFGGAGNFLANSNQLLSSGSIPFNGNGSLQPVVSLAQQARAVFAGVGKMGFPLPGASNLSGTGSLSVATIYIPRVGFFAGSGSLSAYAFRVINVADQFNGFGHMCVQATVRKGRRGPVTNTVVTGPGQSANVTVGGGVG